MDIEHALKATNPLGRIQVLILIATSLVYVATSFIVLSSVFLAEIPPHHCAATPGYTLNETVPVDEDGVYAKCEEFVNSTVSKETQPCSNGWEYDTEIYGESITSEWDLVCSKDYLPELSQSILLAGFAVGSILAGHIADRYGRKPTFVLAIIIVNILGTITTWSPNYAVYVSLKFALGIVFKAVNIPLPTMMFESLLPQHRSTFGNIPPLMGTLSLMLMAVLAALVRDWFYFNLVIMTPTVILMLFVWILPESVRWQISQGRIREAEKTIQRMAKLNGVKGFPSLVFVAKQEMVCKKDVNVTEEPEAQKKNKRKAGITVLFKPPTLIVTFILAWFKFTFTIVYFGFALTTGSLAGDPYRNFFLSSLVELPARIIPPLILKRTGSVRLLLSTYVASGVTMVGIIVIKSTDGAPDWSLTTLSLLGKFLITFSFAPLNLLVTELFPTTVRNSGLGVAQFIGNIGSLSSPLLLYMDKFVSNLSLIFMTGTSFVAAFLCLFLPETLNTTQPETPEDLKMLFKTKRVFRFRKKSHSNSFSIEDPNLETLESKEESGMMNEGFEPEIIEMSPS